MVVEERYRQDLSIEALFRVYLHYVSGAAVLLILNFSTLLYCTVLVCAAVYCAVL